MARLDGRHLLITRSAEDADAWATALSAEGAETTVLPCIRTETIADADIAARLHDATAQADWLVFTSRRGVETCADLLTTPLPDKLRIAVVGEATAQTARDRLGRVDLIGAGTAARLADELATEPSLRAGGRCLLVLAANAGDTLERELAAAGAVVERIDVYRTLPALPRQRRARLSALGCRTILFASPTAVKGFANQVDVDISPQMITIGPSTSAAVRALDWQVTAEAGEPSLSGIIESVMEITND